MNRKLLLIFWLTTLICGRISAQCSSIYGIVGNDGPPWSLVSVDRYNGAITVLDSISNLQSLIASTQTIEPDSNLYVTMGIDNSTYHHIYSINVNTGEVIYQHVMADSNITELNYDVYLKKIFALMYSGSKWYLITVNQYNGNINVLDSITGLHTIFGSTMTLAEDSSTCFVLGSDAAFKQWIYAVDLNTGAEKYKVANDSNIYSFHYDTITKSIHCIRNLFTGSSYKWFFENLNPYTGTVQDVDSIPGLKSFVGFTSAFAQDSANYFFDGIDSISGSQQFYSINSTNGQIIRRPLLGNVNLQYSSTMYLSCSNLVTSLPTLSTDKIKISCYPNPNDGHFEMTFTGLGYQSITIYNETGKKITEQLLDERNVNISLNINLSMYPSGIYFAQILTSHGLENKKILIQK